MEILFLRLNSQTNIYLKYNIPIHAVNFQMKTFDVTFFKF